jgi:chromosome segregation ATPase
MSFQQPPARTLPDPGPTEDEVEAEQRRRRDRRTMWFGVAVGTVGAAVAVIALVVAIGAKNDTVSDEKLAAAVKAQAVTASADVSSELRSDVSAAASARRQIKVAVARARDSEAKLRRQQERLAGSEKVTQQDLNQVAHDNATLRAQYDTLNNEVRELTTDLAHQRREIQELKAEVAALGGVQK